MRLTFASYQTTKPEKDQNYIVVWWYIFYWGSFFMNWFVIPFAMGYLEAGEFTRAGKSWYSIKYNTPFYLAYVIGFLGLLAFLYWTEMGKSIMGSGFNVVGVIIGLNIAGGLLLLSVTLGYGIIKIPIQLFKYTNRERRLKYTQFKVGYHEEKILELLYDKKTNIQNLLFHCRKVEVDEANKVYV